MTSTLSPTIYSTLNYREILGTGSKSFSYASKFLPTSARDDAAVIYTFCRFADDAADDADSPEASRDALHQLRSELRGETASGPVVGAFLEVADRQDIDLRHAEELLSGVETDLGLVRFKDDVDLIRYSYRVAGTVGLLMCPILGVYSGVAQQFAVDLGVGMQLTNICRDVLEDAKNGRVYIPEERLNQEGLDADTVLSMARTVNEADRQKLSLVVQSVLKLADRYYRSGNQGLWFIPWRPRLAILVASRVYQAIGHKLRARGADPMAGRTVLSGVEKVSYAWRAIGGYLLSRSLWSRVPPGHQQDLHEPLQGLPGVHSNNRMA